MTSIISMHMPPAHYGFAFSVLSTSSRVGDIISKLLLGNFTAHGANWRSLFFLASVLQGSVGLVNLSILGLPLPPPKSPVSSQSPTKYDAEEPLRDPSAAGVLDEKKQSHPLEKATVWQAILYALSSMRFWYIALGVASLHVVMEFDKYLPLFLYKSLNIEPGPAAQAAALYPLSQLISLIPAGIIYDKLTPV